MPKEIDESKLNYNKYPGEHVVEYDGVVTIGGDKTFHLVMNFRDGFKADKLEQRFSEILDKYDYIVGDWGFEQLRLKGFFSTSRRKMDAESKIDHLEDYLNEYCNYGAPYFVLRRIRVRDLKQEAFSSERAVESEDRAGYKLDKAGNADRANQFDKPRRKRNRRNRSRDRFPENENRETRDRSNNQANQNNQNSRKPRENNSVIADKTFEIRSKSDKTNKFNKNNGRFKNQTNKSDKPQNKPAAARENKPSQGFVIRTRDKK